MSSEGQLAEEQLAKLVTRVCLPSGGGKPLTLVRSFRRTIEDLAMQDQLMYYDETIRKTNKGSRWA